MNPTRLRGHPGPLPDVPAPVGGPLGRARPPRRRRAGVAPATAAGFSLLELMIVVAILGILATIAYPSFQDQIRKSRRSDAYSAVSSILLLQEKYRANHATYGTLAQIGAAAISADRHYDLSVSGQTASGYTVQAAAVSGGSQAGDQEAGTSCATLTVTVAGSNQTHAPAACWRK